MKTAYVPTFQCADALKQVGAALRRARRLRKESEAMAAQRIGIARATYQRLERGDPSVSAGSIFEALLIYGFQEQVMELGNPDADGVGRRLERQSIKRKGKTNAP